MTDAMAAIPRVHADQVAEFLVRYGALGVPLSAATGPLSVYLLRETGERYLVDLDGAAAFLQRVGGVRMRLSETLSEFVRMFDAGRYPKLVYHMPWETKGAVCRPV